MGRAFRLCAFAAVCLLAACRRAPEASRVPPGPAPGLQAILRFRPPADGLLTDAQIDRYLRVRRAAKGRSELDASAAVGVDPEEFAWVRTRIVEAVAALEERRIRAAADETYARTIAALKETRKSVKDRETLRSVDEQVAGLERERASVRRPPPLAPSVAANARRVASHRAEIDAAAP